ncbi:MAG: stage III sporulation protein AG [Ruminococcus sp.]|nr:stage III sporulation protein AG [Ruminococcus sp.]
MNKISDRIAEFIKGGKVKIIIFVGILGMLLIFLSEFIGSDEPLENEDIKSNYSSSYDTYAQDMEKRLEKTLGKIEGVGKAEVMVTVSGTEEYIYAQEEKIKNGEKDFSTENEYVLIGSGSDKQALLKKVVSPEISGVVIICEGGDSNIVKERVYSSISAAFNISSSQIYVTKLE